MLVITGFNIYKRAYFLKTLIDILLCNDTLMDWTTDISYASFLKERSRLHI